MITNAYIGGCDLIWRWDYKLYFLNKIKIETDFIIIYKKKTVHPFLFIFLIISNAPSSNPNNIMLQHVLFEGIQKNVLFLLSFTYICSSEHSSIVIFVVFWMLFMLFCVFFDMLLYASKSWKVNNCTRRSKSLLILYYKQLLICKFVRLFVNHVVVSRVLYKTMGKYHWNV